MLQIDRFIHPVVLYEYYLIWIFMKYMKTENNEGTSRKNYKSRGGVKARYIMHS